MPWASNKDLPARVKKGRTPKQRRAFRKAYQSAVDQGHDEGAAWRIAYSAASKAAAEPAGPRVVYLVRHAKAEPMGAVEDHLRQLTPKGRAESERIGQALSHSTPPISAVYVSPYTRCVQTARRLADHLGLALLIEPALSKDAPFDPAMAWLKPTSGAALLCTHHELMGPYVQAITDQLLLEDPPGMVVRIEMLAPGKGTLVWAAPPERLESMVHGATDEKRQAAESWRADVCGWVFLPYRGV